MDFLRGRLLRRSPATWSKEGDGGRGFSGMESPSRRGSSTSSWLRERTNGSSWGKEGTSVSSWREAASALPTHPSLPILSRSNRGDFPGPHSRLGDHQLPPQGRRRLQDAIPTVSSRPPQPDPAATTDLHPLSDRTPKHIGKIPTITKAAVVTEPKIRTILTTSQRRRLPLIALPSPWRLEAAAYPPPGLRAGRRREGGGEPGEERFKDGEEESWRREETGGGEDYRSLYQRERQEKEECEVQLAQMDEQRRLLENNLKRFLDLKKELSSFQREAEESDRVVND